MDGPSAAKALRDQGITLPIIGLTGNVLEQDVRVFKAHGANAVLSKPLTIPVLAEGVHSITSPSKSS
jgi:CheY-like chemotaxis protein